MIYNVLLGIDDKNGHRGSVVSGAGTSAGDCWITALSDAGRFLEQGALRLGNWSQQSHCFGGEEVFGSHLGGGGGGRGGRGGRVLDLGAFEEGDGRVRLKGADFGWGVVDMIVVGVLLFLMPGGL